MQPYEKFEQEFSKWMGYSPDQMVACNSGTAALHLAIEVLGLAGCPFQFTVPSYAFISCARAVTLAKVNPIFVDCTDELNIDINKISFSSGGILAVHTYGRRVEMGEIHRQFKTQFVIEDMAEMHGIVPDLRSHAACWSFHRNKIICAEEGGMVALRDLKHADTARRMRNLGLSDSFDFIHTPRGMNYRLTNAQAVILLNSLNYVEENLEDRRKIEAVYEELIPREWKMPTRDVAWVYDLRIPGMTHEIQRPLVRELNAKGIAARCGFYPLNKQVEYCYLGFSCPNAERLAQEIIYLPVNPTMTPDDVKRNVSTLRECVSRVSSL